MLITFRMLKAAAVVGALLPLATWAGPFTFTNVAESMGPLMQLLDSQRPAMNASSQIAFNAPRDSGGRGIFWGSGGALTTIALAVGSGPKKHPLRWEL